MAGVDLARGAPQRGGAFVAMEATNDRSRSPPRRRRVPGTGTPGSSSEEVGESEWPGTTWRVERVERRGGVDRWYLRGIGGTDSTLEAVVQVWSVHVVHRSS